MRHAIDSSRTFNVVGIEGDEFTEASGPVSLKSLFSNARFFAGDDVTFTGVAASPKQVSAGELVVYRIGEDCPSEVVAEAVARGAAGVLTEQVLPCPLPQCIVGDVDLALAEIAANQNNRPDRKLLTVGVIGSAGKTSTALIVSSLLRRSGIRTAYQTDLGQCDGVVQSTPSESLPAHDQLIHWISDSHEAGSQAALIELSEDTARHGGYDSIQFDLLIISSSISRRSDFGESGLQCALERLTPAGVVIAPADDAKTMRVVRDSGIKMISYGVRQAADVSAKIFDQSGGMTTLMMSYGGTTAMMESSLCGAAMASNLCAAAAVGVLIDQPLHEVVENLGQLREIPGRGQTVTDFDHASVVIDAGGSPERAATALRTWRSMKSGGQLWCVMSIDATEIPEELARYGDLIERFADQAIITAAPDSKLKFLSAAHCVLDGVQDCAALRLVADPERAVRWAIAEAGCNDTVLVIGAAGGQTPHQRRSGIDQIKTWIESERGTDASEESSRGEPTILKFSDYQES